MTSHPHARVGPSAMKWPAAPPSGAATLTYLEINGWLLKAGGVTVLIDPILEGNLDFQIPFAVASK